MVSIIGGSNNAPISSNSSSLYPWIDSIEGPAIVNQSSEIIITGGDFQNDSTVIVASNSGFGTVSNVKRTPNEIRFNLLCPTIDVYYIQILNGNNSSNTWNSNNNNPYLISRNPITLTNGWLDFRTVNASTLGTVVSYANTSNTTKTLSTAGFSLDATYGLKIGSVTGPSGILAFWLQFNSFAFSFTNAIYEVIFYLPATNSDVHRLAVGLGDHNQTNFRRYLAEIQLLNNQLNYYSRYENILNLPGNNVLSFPYPNIYNSIGFYKFVFNFNLKKLIVHKLFNVNSLDNVNPIFELPIDFVPGATNTSGCPLFLWQNATITSTVVAMKIS